MISRRHAKQPARPPNVVTDRLIVIGILSFFTIFFWMAFEQAGGSMTIFAKDYTARILSGGSATAFFWANTALTVIPLAIVTYVLAKLIRATYTHIPGSNISIAISFVILEHAVIETLPSFGCTKTPGSRSSVTARCRAQSCSLSKFTH